METLQEAYQMAKSNDGAPGIDGELAAFCGVVGKLVVGEDSARNNVSSHRDSSTLVWSLPAYVSMIK
jgi:hypothetical protein